MPESFADPAAITGYHAHLYYGPETKPIAERLRSAIGARFPWARIGSWHDEPVGPHPVSCIRWPLRLRSSRSLSLG